MTNAQRKLLSQLADLHPEFIAIGPRLETPISESNYIRLAPLLNEFFSLIHRDDNLEISGAAEYSDWMESRRGQRFFQERAPDALSDGSFSDVMFAWVVLQRATHWAWEADDEVDAFNDGLITAVTGRAEELYSSR